MAARPRSCPSPTRSVCEFSRILLRKHFNLHLLSSDIVGNIFRGYGELVGAGNGLLWYEQLPGVRTGACIPVERNR